MSLVAVAACGDSQLLSIPTPDKTPPNGQVPGVNTHLIEDFDNQLLVHSVTGSALLDVNQGVLTLPKEAFPRVEGAGLGMYRGRVEQNGLVEAESIVVSDAASFEASDAVEMRAQDTVRVVGTVQAGRGGVTLVAGRGVYVEGLIESRGPVRILVEDPLGEVRISGRISVYASADDPEDMAPHVEILGRSEVEISGQIVSVAGPRRKGGDIRVRVYGGIKVNGPQAQILATAEEDGQPGVVRLRTEGEISVADEATVGHREPADDSDITLGGDIELQGLGVRVERGARVWAGDGMLKGGSIFVTAGQALAFDTRAEIQSGGGPEGGNLIIKARRIGIGGGTRVQAGRGRSYGAHFEINAVDRLDVVDDALIQGGATTCGPGGAIQVAVGGLVRVRAGAQIRGGDGAIEFGNRVCMTTARGGDVKVQAWSGDGVAQAVFPGRGFPDGEVLLDWDETLMVPTPNLTVGTYGQVRSKIIDRGALAVGLSPRFVGWGAETPAGTTVSLKLCGGSEIADAYERCAAAEDEEAMQSLRDLQYFRYHVQLQGRTFDAPVLDYFELDLSPKD